MRGAAWIGVAMGYVWAAHVLLGRVPALLLGSEGGMGALAMIGSLVR